MAAAGGYMGGKRQVTGRTSEGKRSGEVACGEVVLARVVGHPAGHLGQGRRCREDLRPAAGVDQARGDPVAEVPHDRPVQASSAGLTVGGTEGVHRGKVVRVRR
ncbi:hypothetical protein ACFRKB_35375 [Streptomyces scopuliridis]|uniref:hypothetical protein n=1 Tax=Streptomyces scopuliridis TaxID=452529 RepID=UPI0036940A43